MFNSQCNKPGSRRRGAVAPMVAILLVVIMGMLALSVDVGLIYNTRAELQRCADSAALAAAWELLDEGQLSGSAEKSAEISAARETASKLVQANTLFGNTLQVELNNANDIDGDIVVGYLDDPDNPAEQLSFGSPGAYNSVLVRARKSEVRNGPLQLLFGRVFGFNEAAIEAEAVATFKDGAEGYRINDQTGNADLLPFALHVNTWTDLLSGAGGYGDAYTYNHGDSSVTSGGDGIRELNLYPGGGTGQLPPGNFGTVDIGPSNNSTADISRQILEGISPEDLDYFGGQLRLGPDGTLDLEGDTGLSAAVKDELEAIKGQPRAIPLFNYVTGPGNNAVYTIVGFAGIRIVNVKLTGPMKKKEVMIQPAFVVDDAVMTGPGSGSSYFVYEPVRLVR